MQYRTLLLTVVFALTLTGVAVADNMPATAGNSATASAPATAPAGAMTQSGEVISSSANELVIRTSAGDRKVYTVDAMTVPATPFNVGDRVTVSYNSLAGGGYHASNVTLDTAASADLEDDTMSNTTTYNSTTTTTTGTSTYDANASQQSSSLDARLPDTASNLPLIGLLGLLALAGGWLFRTRS
jgi:hypothetical protein